MYGLMNIKKMFARDTVRKKTENNNKKKNNTKEFFKQY